MLVGTDAVRTVDDLVAIGVNTYESRARPRVGVARRQPAHAMPPRAVGQPVIGYAIAREDASELSSAAVSIDAAASRVGFRLLEMVHDRDNRTHALDRPGLAYALHRIRAGEARGLVVSEIMRATRSVVDLARLVRWFVDADATLIAIDLGIDTSTAHGRHVAAVLRKLGDWERERIMQGTRSGLDVAKARGSAVGLPAVKDRPQLSERIIALRRSGMTLQAIADVLNTDGVPTLRGGARWRPSSVQTVLGYRRPARDDSAANRKDELVGRLSSRAARTPRDRISSAF